MKGVFLFKLLLLITVVASFYQDDAYQDGLRCRILSIDVEYDHLEGEETGHKFRCLTEGDQEPDGLQDMTYMLELPLEFVEAHSYLENGDTYVLIPSGHAIRENEDGTASIYYPNSTKIREIPPTRRHLGLEERRQGVKSLLILRVTALDSRHSLSQAQLSARIFGIGDNAPVVSVRSQYDSCSFGKFKISPATGTGITDGVHDVQIVSAVGKDPFNLENEVTAIAERTLGHLESRFDHVMICLPPGTIYQGTKSKWYAYSYLNWYRTVYNDEWCGYYSVPMHELGHNLALQHSSEASMSYGDQTCMMGYSYSSVGAPSMCFNGHKTWVLGWVSDKSASVDIIKETWSGRLYASVDYLHRLPGNSYVLIRVHNLYLQFNRARRFNSGTTEMANQVTIVSGPSSNEMSSLLGGVALGIPGVAASKRIPNFANTGYTLVIEACEQGYGPPDYVRMSIYLEHHGNQTSSCVSRPSTRPPTKVPTPRPTARPTTPPTLNPISPGTSGVCGDSDGSFRLNPDLTPMITCSQLSTNEMLRKNVCVPSHVAYARCKETCGVCSDNCSDSKTKSFYVNKNWGDQDCKWLKSRLSWQEYLCHPSHDAYHVCGDLCGKCDGSNVLPPLELVVDCDDSRTDMFLVSEEHGYKDCSWLSRNPVQHSRLCFPGHAAYDLCADTCRKCTDYCHDGNGTFFVNDIQGTRDCLWLSEAPAYRENLCREGHAAYTLCKDTCNNCSN